MASTNGENTDVGQRIDALQARVDKLEGVMDQQPKVAFVALTVSSGV